MGGRLDAQQGHLGLTTSSAPVAANAPDTGQAPTSPGRLTGRNAGASTPQSAAATRPSPAAALAMAPAVVVDTARQQAPLGASGGSRSHLVEALAQPVARRGVQLAPPPQRSNGATLVVATAYHVQLPEGSLEVVPNNRYAPKTTSQQIHAADTGLDRWLRNNEDRLIPGEGGLVLNYGKTDRQALIKDVVAYVQGYARANTGLPGLFHRIGEFIVALFTGEKPNVLWAAGIHDTKALTHLSPRQAMLLARQITMDVMHYNYAAIKEDKNGQLTAKAHAIAGRMDRQGVDAFFDPADSGGVCRNYAEVVSAVFDVLKGLQDDPSQLTNSYMKVITSHGATPHAWNALFTVQPDGSVVVTQVDATWSDTGSSGLTGRNDYTFGRSNVRLYWLEHEVLNESSDAGSVVDLLHRLSPSWDPSKPFSVSDAELEAFGGIPALCKAIDELPFGLRGDAFDSLPSDVQAKVKAYRHSKGLPSYKPYSVFQWSA